jgi:site-specific DNA-adenine methylase
MSHFIITYTGNKRKEFKSLEENLDLSNIKNIIEPFCGTSAISFNLWLKYGNKYNYYLNDNCFELFQIYDLIKTNKIYDFLKEVNEVLKILTNKELWDERIRNTKDLVAYFIGNKFYNFRPYLFPAKFKKIKDVEPTNLQKKFFEFIQSPNVFISNDDWLVLFEKYSQDNETIFIMDPPYLQSCNQFYSEQRTLNVYEYFFNNKNLKYKSSIYFILEDNWIIRMLFEDKVINSYKKRYELTNKNTDHIVIKL